MILTSCISTLDKGCSGYVRFFSHADKKLDAIQQTLSKGRFHSEEDVEVIRVQVLSLERGLAKYKNAFSTPFRSCGSRYGDFLNIDIEKITKKVTLAKLNLSSITITEPPIKEEVIEKIKEEQKVEAKKQEYIARETARLEKVIKESEKRYAKALRRIEIQKRKVEVQNLIQNNSLGRWYDIATTLYIVKEEDFYFLIRKQQSGSWGEHALLRDGNRFSVFNDRFGAYYVISSSGHLEIYDQKGYIRSAGPL